MTACVAVGSDVDEPAATRWDGTRWISEPIANPAPDAPNGSVLEGVSCTSPSNCIGVGNYQQNRRPFLQLPLVERWDGARWSQQSTPSLGDSAPFSGLNAVSCVSRDACIAVGSTQVGSTAHPLIERWDGATWSIQSTTGKVSGELEGVSCTSGDACTAVGEGSRPFAERWDGTTWSTQVLPGRGELHDVSCPTRGACVAVGQFYGAAGAGTSHATVELWDGTRWRLHRLHGAARKAIGLNGVACTSPTACVAVGDEYANPTGDTETLAERWDGNTWTREPTPDPPRRFSAGNNLRAVSCRRTLICTAVGDGDYALAEQRAVPLGLSISRIRTLADGMVRLTIRVSGPGRIDVLETAWNNNLAHAAVLLKPAPGRFLFARKVIRTTGPGTVQVDVLPNRRGSLLVTHHRYPVVLRLWISYTPAGGHSRSTGFYGLRLATDP